jgi:hypothetical protein
LTRKPELDEFVHRVRAVSAWTRLDEAAAETVSSLEAAGIEPLLLKGPALARLLYRPGEHRSYSDVDLMVAPADLPQARAVLAELGFTNSSDWFNRFTAEAAPETLHGELWARTRKLEPVLVDLHWKLEGCELAPDLAWERLASHRTAIEVGGRQVAVLDRDALALHVALHAAQHGPGHTRTAADLTRAVERWGPAVWRAAAELAEDLQGTPAFAAGLCLNPAGRELADDLGLPDTGRLDWAMANRDERPQGAVRLDALLAAPGIRAKLGVARRALFPWSEWIVWQYPWAGGGRLRLTAAYAAHLARTPAWAVRAWRYRRRELRAGR